ncbi:MAG: hypothetical protein ACOYOA_10360 [Saprospiraceae bacterium]
MKRIIGIFVFLVSTFAMLFFSACNKETLQDAIDNLVTGQDLSTVQTIMENDEDEIVADEIGFRGGACVVKTFSAPQGTYPQTITLDFGAGCEGKNGHVRKGTLIVNVSADPKTNGAIVVVNPSNFFVDDIKVEGIRTWTNLGTDANNNKSLSRKVVGGKLTFPNGKTVTFESTEFIVQTAGGATKLNKTDDVYEISGTRTGVNRNGKEYTATIGKALVKNGTCPYIVSGTINISKDGASRSLDYGNGDCDSEGLLTLSNGTTRTIQLKRWW